MEYRRSDSSGTDDDLPPSQPGRLSTRGGHVSGNERAMSGSRPYRHSSAPDQHVRKLEQDAYIGVLRAFRAQSEAITWRKEQVMVTLRRELGITDEEHLEIVSGMDSDNAPSQLRERDEHVGPMYVPNVESYPGATMPVSRKRQKSTHISQASPVPPTMKSALSPPSLAPVSTGKQAPPVGGSRRQKSRGGHQQQTGLAVGARLPSLGDSSAGEVMADPWIGKRGKTRWPEDTAFNEAVITDYDPKKKGPPRANLTMGSRGAAGRGSKSKRGGERSGILSTVGRGQSASKGPADSFERPAQELPPRSWKAPTPENGLDMKGMKHIQIPTLDALIKQVDKIAEEDDLAKVESIRRTAKEHEEMLRKALAEIGESSEEGDTGPQQGIYLVFASEQMKMRIVLLCRRTLWNVKGREVENIVGISMKMLMRTTMQGIKKALMGIGWPLMHHDNDHRDGSGKHRSINLAYSLCLLPVHGVVSCSLTAKVGLVKFRL